MHRTSHVAGYFAANLVWASKETEEVSKQLIIPDSESVIRWLICYFFKQIPNKIRRKIGAELLCLKIKISLGLNLIL